MPPPEGRLKLLPGMQCSNHEFIDLYTIHKPRQFSSGMLRSKASTIWPCHFVWAPSISLRWMYRYYCASATQADGTLQSRYTSHTAGKALWDHNVSCMRHDDRSAEFCSELCYRRAEEDGQGQHQGNDWGQKQRRIYLYPWKSRQPWKSWLSLHRKSVTCYSQAKLSWVKPHL